MGGGTTALGRAWLALAALSIAALMSGCAVGTTDDGGEVDGPVAQADSSLIGDETDGPGITPSDPGTLVVGPEPQPWHGDSLNVTRTGDDKKGPEPQPWVPMPPPSSRSGDGKK